MYRVRKLRFKEKGEILESKEYKSIYQEWQQSDEKIWWNERYMNVIYYTRQVECLR